jgi:hypothetical protein
MAAEDVTAADLVLLVCDEVDVDTTLVELGEIV